MTCLRNNWSLALLRGSEQPLSGWISRSFDVKSPITTAVWSSHITGTTEVVTQISISVSSNLNNKLGRLL